MDDLIRLEYVAVDVKQRPKLLAIVVGRGPLLLKAVNLDPSGGTRLCYREERSKVLLKQKF
jgi:hypothetical protein